MGYISTNKFKMGDVMKVLHIGTEYHGGAGLGMLRLHKDLLAQGVDSRILCLQTNKSSADERIYGYLDNPIVGGQIKKNLIAAALNRLHLYSTPYYKFAREVSKLWRYHAMVSSPYVRLRVEESQLVHEADIIHLHWIANFVNYATFFKAVKNKPIVWTLRDENPSLGFWHFRKDMPKNLLPRECRIDEQLRQRKARFIGKALNLAAVSLSREEDEWFASSEAFRGRQHVIIPNSIDGSVFYSRVRRKIRKNLGISEQETVLVFVAQHLSEPRKGLADLLSALVRIARKELTLICVGDDNFSNIRYDGRVIITGRISDASHLAEIYSASDLFVSPSKAETFGKTLTEALACGVPVVSYPNAGAKDILFDESMGVLCKDFTVDSLIVALRNAMGIKYDKEIIRRKVLSRFSRERVAKAYVDLYEKLLRG